jgi:hypothetical protein
MGASRVHLAIHQFGIAWHGKNKALLTRRAEVARLVVCVIRKAGLGVLFGGA